MASLEVKAPDGKTLEVAVPDGTSPDKYGALADDALSHYTAANPPAESGMGSFVRAAGNMMPLGSQFASLVAPGKYSDNMAAQNAALQANQAAHPIASGAGSVAGGIAPALVPGVGEMMAANPATAGAILGGTGAIANTDIKKNPLQAVQQAGMGASTGALISGLLAKIIPPARQALESKANTLANKSVHAEDLIDMTPAERQAQGSMLRNAGIVVKDKEEAFNKAKDLLTGYGEKIGTIAKTTEGQGLVANPDEHLGAISDLLEQAQKYSASANKGLKAIGRDYRDGATDILNLGDNPSWNAIQDLKETWGKTAFKENSTQGAKDTYFSLANMLKGIADKAQGDPSLGPQYKEALAGYSQLAPVVENLKKVANDELSGKGAGMGVRGMIGLIRQLPGPVRAAVGTTAAVMGHPYLAGMAAIPELTNKALQSQAAGAVANMMPAISRVAAPVGAAVGNQAINAISQNPQAQAILMQVLQKLRGQQ